MARPPLPLGTPGAITVTAAGTGRWVASCRFRDHDGVTRLIRKHGSSKTRPAARSTTPFGTGRRPGAGATAS